MNSFRPHFHYTAQRHWINDPNGLVFDGVKYHAFAQYNPMYPVVDEKHWSHAVSDDLIKWEHLSTAISPDSLGQTYSGSAVYDAGNTSGFGKDGHPPIVAMFTSHGEHEQQSIAYSVDGVNFTMYAHNPVIPNVDIIDFRDPKIFRNDLKNCWSMVLAAGDRVMFYSSENLVDWAKTGEFEYRSDMFDGVWECPDMLKFELSDGTEKWVLIVSHNQSPERLGARTLYYVGGFDGDRFILDDGCTPKWFDNGFDNYASVSFHNAPNCEKIVLGWQQNWKYSDLIPGDEFKGMLTLPRVLSLKEMSGEYVICQKPVTALGKYFGTPIKIDDEYVLNSDVFKLSVCAESDFELCLFNDDGEVLKVGRKGNELYCDRSGCVEFMDGYDKGALFLRSVAERVVDGNCELDIYFDVCGCEIFADGGSVAMTNLVYPKRKFDKIKAVGGDCSVSEII